MMEDDWMPIDTAPKKGVFLVWLEEPLLGSHIHTMNKHPNVSTIASNFTFDVPKPTHWRPMLAPPKEMVVVNNG